MAIMTGNIGVELHLRIKQGADFAIDIDFQNPDETPFDLTPYLPVARIRKKPGDPATAFICSTSTPGRLRIALAHATTLALQAGRFLDDELSSYVWDCEFVAISGGWVIPALYGNVVVWRDI